MAFGLNIDFSGIIGKLTKSLRGIVASKIQNLSKMVKTNLINTATSSLGGNIKGMIGTSLNLNMSKLTGGINFANALKGLPFPSLGSLNLNSLYGLIDENIGVNLNNFTKNLAKNFKELNLDDLSLGDKLNSALTSQVSDIGDEIEAGIIAGKSNLDVLGSMDKLSNTQIRDFNFSPEKQLAFVNTLEQQQKDKIFDLTFNSVSETSIFDTQITDISNNSVDSPIDTFNTDFSFFNVETAEQASVNKEAIADSQFKIKTITQVDEPVTRKIDLTNRYNKEEETLTYLEFLKDDLITSEVTPTRSVSYTNLTAIRDPYTNEILLYNAIEVTGDNVNDPSKRRRVILDHDGNFVEYG